MGYSRAEMVDEAKAAGHTVTQRLVTDWSSLGLLAKPERVNRGEGSGSAPRYEWSQNQRDLFVALLGHRPGGKDIVRLCVIPVATWMIWGDEWVGLPQVRQALSTWAGSYRKHYSTEERALQYARLTVDQLAAPEAGREVRRRLREQLVEALRTDKFDTETLTPALRAVIDPHHSGRRHGPFQNTAEDMVKHLRSTLTGLQALDKASDGLLLEARARYRMFVTAYRQLQPQFASDAAFGEWFEKFDINMLFNRACRDLVTHVGLVIIAREEELPLPPIQFIKRL